jgi:hypothetical protein
MLAWLRLRRRLPRLALSAILLDVHGHGRRLFGAQWWF